MSTQHALVLCVAIVCITYLILEILREAQNRKILENKIRDLENELNTWKGFTDSLTKGMVDVSILKKMIYGKDCGV